VAVCSRSAALRGVHEHVATTMGDQPPWHPKRRRRWRGSGKRWPTRTLTSTPTGRQEGCQVPLMGCRQSCGSARSRSASGLLLARLCRSTLTLRQVRSEICRAPSGRHAWSDSHSMWIEAIAQAMVREAAGRAHLPKTELRFASQESRRALLTVGGSFTIKSKPPRDAIPGGARLPDRIGASFAATGRGWAHPTSTCRRPASWKEGRWPEIQEARCVGLWRAPAMAWDPEAQGADPMTQARTSRPWARWQLAAGRKIAGRGCRKATPDGAGNRPALPVAE